MTGKAARILAGCIVAVLLTAGLATLPGCGEERDTYSPSPVEEFSPLVNLGSHVVLSSEQNRLILEHGYPSHFFITMDSLTGDRIETWTYFPLAKSYTFHEGRLVREEAAEDQSEKYPPTVFQPENFGPGLSLGEAESLLGAPFRDSEFTGSGGESVIVLFYDGAVLDYADGRLTGVETMVRRFEDFPETTFP